jgi:hypothetical protein
MYMFNYTFSISAETAGSLVYLGVLAAGICSIALLCTVLQAVQNRLKKGDSL